MYAPLFSRVKTRTVSLILLALALITPGAGVQAHGSQGYATDVYYRNQQQNLRHLEDHKEKLKIGLVIHILSYDERRKLFLLFISTSIRPTSLKPICSKPHI
jgi:hypothetical protein